MQTIKIERRQRKPFPTFRPKRGVLSGEQLRAIAKYAALAVAGVILFRIGQARALAERGYEAIGGEGFALFLPVIYYLVFRTIGDTVRDIKGKKR